MRAWDEYFVNVDDLRWALAVAEEEVRPLSLALDKKHAREGRNPHPISAGVFVSLLRYMAAEGTSRERVHELVDRVWEASSS